jgi:hypothetical protein
MIFHRVSDDNAKYKKQVGQYRCKSLYLTSPFGAVFQCALHFTTLLETTKSVPRLAADSDLELMDDVEFGAIWRRELESSVRRDVDRLASYIKGTVATAAARDTQLTVGSGLSWHSRRSGCDTAPAGNANEFLRNGTAWELGCLVGLDLTCLDQLSVSKHG